MNTFGGSFWSHQRLAHYFEQQPFSTRKVEEYPWHLMATDETDKLEEFLSQPKVFAMLYTDVNKHDLFKLWNYFGSDWRQMSVHSYSCKNKIYSSFCLINNSIHK